MSKSNELSDQLNGPERERLLFYIEHGEMDAAKQRALESAKIYRKSVLNNGRNNRPFCFASTREYRGKYIRSYLHFKKFAISPK